MSSKECSSVPCPLWAGSGPGNTQHAFAVFTPLAAFVGEAGAARRAAASTTATTVTITILGYIDKIQAVTAIGEHRAHAGRIASNHGGN